MKRFRILLTLTALALPFLATANASAQVAITLTGGINRGSWTTDIYRFADQDFKPVTRLSTGLAVTIPLPGIFAIEFGGAYSQKGGRLEVPESAAGGTFEEEGGGRDEPLYLSSTLEANYFELTVLGRMNLTLVDNRVSAFVVGGPAWAWEISCQRSFTWAGYDDWPPGDTVVTCPDGSNGTEYLSRDFGLVHGGGLEVGVTADVGFTLGLFHTLGKRNLLVSKPSHYTDYLKLRTLTFRGGIVYRIG